jgi:hypothetical protein
MSASVDANEAVEFLLNGIAPERKDELLRLWEQHQPEVHFLEDNGRDGKYVLEGGLFRIVRFNHRAMRLFWLGAFIAWEGYVALHRHLITQDASAFERFTKMMEAFYAMKEAPDSSEIPMPEGVPEPGVFPSDAESRVAAELAVFSAGWALLHEIRHIQKQQKGTSAGPYAPREEVLAEENCCDKYATKYIIEKISDYAKQAAVPEELVRTKRQVGILFALFTMTLILRDAWGETDGHSALQERINAVRSHFGATGITGADVIVYAAFAALRTVLPEAPGLVR